MAWHISDRTAVLFRHIQIKHYLNLTRQVPIDGYDVAMGQSRWVLITAAPPSRLPGAVPTAPVGRLLAQLLLDAGQRVRALVPASERQGWATGVDVIEGCVTDPEATPAAFDDIERVFLAGLVSIVPERLRQLTNLLVTGPLSQVVVLSSHGSDFETAYSAETWEWLAFERAMEIHGASLIHLRPAGLFAGAIHGGYPISGADWLTTLAHGEPVREFLADVAYPFMDEADLAAIAARLLLDDTIADVPASGKLDVVGCLSSARNRFACLNEVMGRRHRLVPLANEQEARYYWRSRGWPDITIGVTLYAMQAFQQASEATRQAVDSQISTAAKLLGRAPRTFTDWIRDHSITLAKTL